MIIIIIILCAFSRVAMAQTSGQDISPANIFRTTSGTIFKGSDLELKCSLHGRNDEQNMVHIYLCRNDVAVKRGLNKKDHLFTLKSVTTHESGNYSCVFSSILYELSKIRGKTENYISIQVIDRILPADISPTGLRKVKWGESVEFKCTISDLRFQTEDMSIIVHSYLCKNGTVVQMQIFDVKNMEATFTLKSVIRSDTGNYSCVIDLQPNIFDKTDCKLYGNNETFLNVDVWSDLITVLSCLFFLLILSLILGTWWLIRKEEAVTLCCGRTPPKEDVATSEEGVSKRRRVKKDSSDEYAGMAEADHMYQEVADETRSFTTFTVPSHEADDTYQEIVVS
ncbi:hypothetical protein UPYG_G00083290 [Umbra pygmaea]|uniref:Ig-like domain-containing protein n=1 Tax=Umbra pygmaea TaxID=75934 RepID=A0ABD0XE57_UMBPY